MKPAPRYSSVFGVHAALMMLLVAAGIFASLGERATLRLTTFRVVGTLLGVWIPWQLLSKGSVCVWAWEVKGPFAAALAFLGGLPCILSVYALAASVFR